MASTIVTDGGGWSVHLTRCVTQGVETAALFGQDGKKWGGASLSTATPLYGVRTIPKFSTLMADLKAGRVSLALDLDAIHYMATKCIAGASIYGKKASGPCCGIGLTKQALVVLTADTSRGGSPAALAVQLGKAVDYFVALGF